ncbi:hypothetical protein BMR85_027500 [Achromobacter sp. KAs 3-5]|nr:hypothetical protein BMR85_027500 [Achromobacter sp. KAs 3-5]
MATKKESATVLRSFELAEDGSVERAYVHCEYDGCRDLTTRTVVEDEAEVQRWARRHYAEAHEGQSRIKVQGAWPRRSEEAAWMRTTDAHELVAMVRHEGRTVEDVAEDTMLDDELTEWLSRAVNYKNVHRRREVLIAHVRRLLVDTGPMSADEIQARTVGPLRGTMQAMQDRGMVEKNENGLFKYHFDDIINVDELEEW